MFENITFFGSEIKFIKSLSNTNFSISEKQISRYLIQGYKSLYKYNSTFYENIEKVKMKKRREKKKKRREKKKIIVF